MTYAIVTLHVRGPLGRIKHVNGRRGGTVHNELTTHESLRSKTILRENRSELLKLNSNRVANF